jgi:hypothetical protein
MSTTQEQMPTVREIADAFGNTIFWNSFNPWPGIDKDPELPLEVNEGKPDEDSNRTVHLVYGSGEIDVTVATIFPANANQDAECRTTDADVAFVANLPVYVPALLKQIDDLKVGLEKALRQLHRPDDAPDRASTRRYLELLLDAAE